MNRARSKCPIVLSTFLTALLLTPLSASGAERLPTSRTPVYWIADNEIRRSAGVAFDASGLVPKGALEDWGFYQRRGSKASMLVNYFTGKRWLQRTFPVSFRKTASLGRSKAVAVQVDAANAVLYAYPTGKFDTHALRPENSWPHAITPTPRNSQLVLAYEERGKSSMHLRTVDLNSNATIRDVVIAPPSLFIASAISWGTNDHTVIVQESAVHWSKAYAIDTITGTVSREVTDQWLTVKGGKILAIVPRP